MGNTRKKGWEKDPEIQIFKSRPAWFNTPLNMFINSVIKIE